MEYVIETDTRFKHLELIDVGAIAEACTLPWWNQTLTEVNDSVVRLGVVEGEFHWHKHDEEDEFFYVLSGRLEIELEGRTVVLEPGQGVTVPKGVMHCPRAPVRTVMLMVEKNTVQPTGD